MSEIAGIETDRLLLQKPGAADVDAIFHRYAADPAVCRYLSWPMHQSIGDTEAFLEFSDAEWQRWPAGPYLITSKFDDYLLGSTGLAFESSTVATTGYALARDCWGKGFATEALLAMRALAAELNVEHLYAQVHPQHQPSRRVLEKAGFVLDGTLEAQCKFPNLKSGRLFDVVTYSWSPGQ